MYKMKMNILLTRVDLFGVDLYVPIKVEQLDDNTFLETNVSNDQMKGTAS